MSVRFLGTQSSQNILVMQKIATLSKPLCVGKSYQLRFMGGGDVIAVGRDLVLWSVLKRKRLRSCHPFKHPGQMDISPSGAHIVVKNTSGQLVVLSSDSLEMVVDVPFDGASEGGRPLYSPCGTQIVDSSWNGLLRLLDCSTGNVVHQELSAGVMLNSMTCDAGRTVFAYVKQPKVPDRVSRTPFSHVVTRRWPFIEHCETEISVGDAYVDSVSLSPDGNRLAVLQTNISAEFSLNVIDLSTGGAIASRGVDPGGTNRSLAWSPDGSRLCCVEKGQLSVFDSTSLNYVARHVDAYPCYAEFSADGMHIAIGSWENGTVLRTDQLEPIA